jgi:probable HAF family extracellular repeat protein
MMKKFMLLAAVLFASVTFTYAQFQFTSIDYPGGVGTRTRGINNHGQIVGSYNTEDGTRHALLIDKGKFIPLAPETILGTDYSDAYKINDRGDVVGWDCDDVTCHAFLLSKKGVLTLLDFPGATLTYGFDINESGTVAGVWDLFDSQGNFLYEGGFLWKDGNFTEVTFPGAGDTAVTGINARGDFVGLWDDGPPNYTNHGFVFSKGEFTSFDPTFPDLTSTQPDGINAHGDIIGQDIENGITHGFLKVGANFIKIDYPGAVLTSGWGINAAGQMVGNWFDSAGTVHGWLAH